MSWEAWGDDSDDYMDQACEQLLDAGWLSSEDARALRGEALALSWERMVLYAAWQSGSMRDLERAWLCSEASSVSY